jgi:hypothetical protein
LEDNVTDDRPSQTHCATLENQGSNEAKDSDGDPVTHRSDPMRLSAGEIDSGIDFGFYRRSCGNHYFTGDHRDDAHDDGSDHHELIDWSRKSAKTDLFQEVKLKPCSPWVKPFVCEVETETPNKGIKVALSLPGDQGFSKLRHRKR